MKRAALSLVSVAGLVLTLAGCTSTQDVLQPSALTTTQPTALAAPSVQASPPSPANTSESSAPVAMVTEPTRVHFAPVVGATTAAAAPLRARLSARAEQMGIDLAAAGDDATTHVMKGYFSAITEGDQTTVIYVWDVLDPAGNRVHRIQGQQQVTAEGGGGWSSVQPTAMEAIADQTVNQFMAWLGARAG